MPATLTYENLSDVPEALRDNATENDGKYTVAVEPAAKLKEFRENNIAISQERDEVKGLLSGYEQVTGVSLEAIKDGTGSLDDFAKTLTTLKETKQRVDDGALVENTSLEEAAAKRVEEAHANYRDQLASMAKERDAHKERADKADQRANNMVVENAVRIAAAHPDVAMLDKAVTHVLPAIQAIYNVDEKGEIVPKAADGTILYGSNGIDPMPLTEWLQNYRKENDFLFKGSKGGGSTGGSGGEGQASDFNAMQAKGMNPAQAINAARRAGKA